MLWIRHIGTYLRADRGDEEMWIRVSVRVIVCK